MEYKAIPMEVKVDHNKREITGYASTFGNRDQVGDIVQKGAFKKTIAERYNGGEKRDIKVLWQHVHPIGLPIHMEEDSTGLLTVSKIAKTEQGDEALILADEGVVDKMSIGYDIIKESYDGNDRILQELKLYEYSLVTFPANEMATITGVNKSLGLGLGQGIGDMTALLKSLQETDLTTLLEGRIITTDKEELIKNAIEALQGILDVAEQPVQSTAGRKGSTQPQNIDLDPDEIQSWLSEFKSIQEELR